MSTEEAAYKQWKAEGGTPESAQFIQDARLDFAILKQKLAGVEAQIAALESGHDVTDDADEKSELAAELMRLNIERSELERQIGDTEKEFKEQGASPDVPTMH